MGILVGVKWVSSGYLSVVLICIFLMTKKDILFKRKKKLSLLRDEVGIKSLMSQFQTGSQFEITLIFIFLYHSGQFSTDSLMIIL